MGKFVEFAYFSLNTIYKTFSASVYTLELVQTYAPCPKRILFANFPLAAAAERFAGNKLPSKYADDFAAEN